MAEFNKNSFLQSITEAVQNGQVTRGEVEAAIDIKSGEKSGAGLVRGITWSYPKILGLIGGLIVFLGIVFLVSLYWAEMNDATQIAVTLGSGILAYICGNLLMIGLKEKFVGASIHLIAGLMLPFGIGVLISKIFQDSQDGRSAVAVSGLIFLFVCGLYILTDWRLKSNLFTVFAALFGSITYWLGFGWVVWDQGQLVSDWRLWVWAWLVSGAVYLLAGYWLENGLRRPSGIFLMWLGNLSILASLLGLLWDRGILEILYVFVLSGWFYLSTVLKNRGYLIQGVIFLIVYLLYLNGKYFWNTLGWPVGLILSGLILIAASYGAVVWNKRFIKESSRKRD